MVKQILNRIVAIVIILALTAGNLLLIGTESYAAFEELEEQRTLSSDKNVSFDTFFYVENKNVHSVTLNASNEAIVNFEVKVGQGYLKDSKIELQNANFEIIAIEAQSEEGIVSSFEKNKIMLNQISSNTNVVVSAKIKLNHGEIVEADYLARETIANFAANYTNIKGKESQVTSNIKTRIEWVAEAEANLDIAAEKYMFLNNKTIIQTKITSGIKENVLPVKNSNMKIEASKINNILPEEVRVMAVNTKATNGIENGNNFTKDNYTYNKETGLVEIKVENNANSENKISWKKGTDEYIVTYIYEGTQNISNIELKAQNELTTYKETVAQNQVQKTQEIAVNGNNVDYALQATQNISKGYMYANSEYETEYTSTWSANVSYVDSTDTLIFQQNTDKFYTESGKQEYVNSYYKQTKINRENFNKILGEEGKLEIYNGENLIGTINKDTEVNQEGNYVYNYEGQIANIKIVASKPTSEGKLIINNTKAITAKSPYTLEQMREFKGIENSLVASSANQEVQDIKVNTELTETTSKAVLKISKENLSTVVKNEDVEIRAILKADDINCDLYKNPTVEITLPEEVTELNVKSAHVLFADGMEIKAEKEDNRIIRVMLTGEQTNFVTDGNEGITIILNTDITLNKLATSKKTNISMKYTNEKAVAIENDGIKTSEVNIVAPTGVITLNNVQNTKTGKTATSIESTKGEVELERNSEKQIATYTNTIINNNGSTISNVKILGNIPFQGDSLGSTINTKIETPISSPEGTNAEIYYSEKADANTNLEDLNNAWKTEITENTKTYLIVINENVEQGKTLNFTYNLALPENLTYGVKANSTYKVEYKEGSSTAGQIAAVDASQFMSYAIAEEGEEAQTQTRTATEVELTTGEGPVLEGNVTFESNLVDEIAYKNQVIEYTLTVTNTGTSSANNVKAKITIPEEMCYGTYQQIEMGPEFVEDTNKEITLDIGQIDADKTKTISFYLKAKEVSENVSVKAEVFSNEVNSFVAGTLQNEIKDSSIEVKFENLYDVLDYTTGQTQKVQMIVGEEYAYYLDIVNLSEEELKNNVITCKLPDCAKYIEAKVDLDRTDEETINNTSIEYDEGTNTITINMKVLKEYIGIYLNITPISTEKGEFYFNIKGKNFEENTQKEMVSAISPETNINAISSIDGYIKSGDTFEYELTLTNNSSVNFESLDISYELPDEISYENVYLNGEEYDDFASNGNIISFVESLNAGETLELRIEANVFTNEELTEDKNISTKLTIDGINYEKEFKYIIEKNKNSQENPEDPTNPDNPETYKISGTAWVDNNKDGSLGQEETKLSGITVKAVNSSGEEKATATTTNEGVYTLEGLEKGKYTVIFEYNTSKYLLTTYKKEGVEESSNSKAVKGTYGGKQVATTDTVEISDRSIANINIGLIEGSTFDLALSKKVTQIAMANTKTTKTKKYNTQLAKIDLDYKYINNTQVAVEYEITVTNEGDIPGYATKIVDYLPKEFDFSTELNKDWYTSGDKIETKALADTIINPGESQTVTLVLTKNMTENGNGIVANTAEIEEAYNEYGVEDIDSTPGNKKDGEDDISTANVILGLKTGGPVTYITLTLTIMVLISIGAYEINKRVLKV